jgi:hypothetical protein
MSLAKIVAAIIAGALFADAAQTQTPPAVPAVVMHDGAHDFDFLIGDWRAHLWRLPDRLVGSTKWLEYEGTSSIHKIYGSDANMEEFKVHDAKDDLSIHAQTLRLYDPKAHQWSVYGIDVDHGQLGLPATVGEARTPGLVELYDTEPWDGRMILVRLQWKSISPTHAHLEQAFSADGGKTWEANWINDLTRDAVGSSNASDGRSKP